jgi:hypothetical protein
MTAVGSESWLAVHDLMQRYAACVDQADFDGLGELFAHGTMRANVGDDVMTGAEVRDFYAATNRVHPNGTLSTRHLATNVVIDVDDAAGRATARSYFTVLQATDVLALQPIVAGRYHDEFHVVDGAWCFADRMVIVDLIGDMSQHLSIDLRTERVDVADAIGRPLAE